MSFRKLPDELVAQVATHLNYPDLCNFMESSKRIYKAIKYFKADKIKLDTLDISTDGNVYVESCDANIDGCGSYTFKKLDKTKEPLAMIKGILDQCRSISTLILRELNVTSSFLPFINKTKAKIGNLCFYDGNVDLSKEDFISLCQKFKNSTYHMEFNKELWSDEVLCAVLPITCGFTRWSFDDVDGRAITDQTLSTLIRENGVQRHFNAEFVRTSFTVQGIVDLLTKAVNLRLNDLEWKFGTLSVDQLDEAVHQFHPRTGVFGHYAVQFVENFEAWGYEMTPIGVDEYVDPDNIWEDGPEERTVCIWVAKD